MYTGDSITNDFWTWTATKDEYFATSGSSGTSLTAYALCVPLVLSSSGNFQRFDTQSAFIAANASPTIVSYDSIVDGSLPTYEYTFTTE